MPFAAWAAPVFLIRFFRDTRRWLVTLAAIPALALASFIQLLGGWDLDAWMVVLVSFLRPAARFMARAAELARQEFFETSDRLMLADVPTRGMPTVYAGVGEWFPYAGIAPALGLAAGGIVRGTARGTARRTAQAPPAAGGKKETEFHRVP